MKGTVFGQEYELYVFDLDNTLYDEGQYMLPIYATLAEELARRSGRFKAAALRRALEATFAETGTHRLFDRVFPMFGINKAEGLPIALKALRYVKHKELLPLYTEVYDLLEALQRAGKRTAVLTNGHPDQQRNKIAAIEWRGLDAAMTFCLAADHKPKPAPDGLVHLIHECETSAEDTVFVGDRSTDRRCAEAAGVDFVAANKIRGWVTFAVNNYYNLLC